MEASLAATADAFSEYVLARIGRDPSLVGESPQSILPGAASPTTSELQRGLVHRAKTDGTFAAPTLASVPSAKPSTGILKAPESAEEKAAKATLVQRAVVDRPLLPLGADHLIHDVLWPVVEKATHAAKNVFTARVALDAWRDAKTETPAVESPSPVLPSATVSSSSPVLVRRSEEEAASLTAAVAASEAALRAAREELAAAFAKLRARVAAMENYLNTPSGGGGGGPGVEPSASRKRPRDAGDDDG